MKIRTLALAILLAVLPCSAQIDYNTQVRNKSIKAGSASSSLLWISITDPSLAVATVKHIQSKATAGYTVTTDTAVTSGNLLILSYGSAGWVDYTNSNGTITDSFGTVFTRAVNTPYGISIFTGVANGSGIDTITITNVTGDDHIATIVSEFSGVSNVVDSWANVPVNGGLGDLTTTSIGDLIYTSERDRNYVGLPSNFSPAAFAGSLHDGIYTSAWSTWYASNSIGVATVTHGIDGCCGATGIAAIAMKAKSIGVGSNGDFAINTTTNKLFGPKVGGVWPTTGVQLGTVGFSGTKTAGSCVLTVLNGVITDISGC